MKKPHAGASPGTSHSSALLGAGLCGELYGVITPMDSARGTRGNADRHHFQETCKARVDAANSPVILNARACPHGERDSTRVGCEQQVLDRNGRHDASVRSGGTR
jgi:hypothetical protein